MRWTHCKKYILSGLPPFRGMYRALNSVKRDFLLWTHVYRIYTYTQDGRLFEGNTPPSAFLNSSYDGSFIAGLMELCYIQSLSIERIVRYFEDHGFTLNKPTAHKLTERASPSLQSWHWWLDGRNESGVPTEICSGCLLYTSPSPRD